MGGTEHSSTEDRSPISTPSSSVGVAESRFSYQGLGCLCLEAALERLALLVLQKAGVLGRDHPPEIALG